MKKNRVQLASLGVHLILKSKWKYDFCPHYHAICNINWMGVDSWKSFPFEENIYEISQVWIVFIVLLLWFKRKNDFFR